MENKIDVFERYYSFSRLNKENPYYELKKQNYLAAKEAYFSDKTDLNTLPLRATVQTTDFCNLNCIMCQIHSQEENHTLKQMAKSDFDKIVQKLFPTLIEVHPTNIGEPLISPWFDYLAEKAFEYGVLLDITSNGTLLTEEKIKKILPSLLDIKISFDGAKKETFEKIRKGADFDKVVQNIKNFVRLRNASKSHATITLQMTLFNFNYTELPDVIRLAKDLGVDKVKAYHVFSYSSEIDNFSLMNNLSDFEKVRAESIELAKNIRMNVSINESLSENQVEAEPKLVHQKCRLPWAECFIDFDGEVYPCHTHNHKSYGNIFESDSESVWSSPYAIELRNALVTGKTENTICFNCGNNFVRVDKNAAVPFNKDDYLFNKTGSTNINWGKRCKQFLLNR
ncbi:MAG: radical SAM protein [Treponema sp.]|nr:radical SAM protein [Treponema sp.]